MTLRSLVVLLFVIFACATALPPPVPKTDVHSYLVEHGYELFAEHARTKFAAMDAGRPQTATHEIASKMLERALAMPIDEQKTYVNKAYAQISRMVALDAKKKRRDE